MRLFVGLGFLERGDLRFGEQDAVLRRFGLKRLQAMLHRGQIVALPHAAHPRRRDRQLTLLRPPKISSFMPGSSRTISAPPVRNAEPSFISRRVWSTGSKLS